MLQQVREHAQYLKSIATTNLHPSNLLDNYHKFSSE